MSQKCFSKVGSRKNCDCPLGIEKVKFKSDSDIDAYMKTVEEGRIAELYPHQKSERCLKKG